MARELMEESRSTLSGTRFGVLLASLLGLAFGLASAAESRDVRPGSQPDRLLTACPLSIDLAESMSAAGQTLLVEDVRSSTSNGLVQCHLPGSEDHPAFNLTPNPSPTFHYTPWVPALKRLHADGKPIPEFPLLLRQTSPVRG